MRLHTGVTYWECQYTLCPRVGAHVLHERERKKEKERREREGEGEGGRGNSPALPSDCVQCKGVQPSPAGISTHSKGQGEGKSLSLSHTPPPPLLSPSDVV